MPGRIINYYADGNTAKGFYSFHKSNVNEIDALYIILGSPGTGKSTLMKKVGIEGINRGFDVEFMHSSSDNNSISGIIIPQLKTAMIDGNINIEPINTQKIAYIDLDTGLRCKELDEQKDKLIELDNKKQQILKSAFKAFSEALEVHDEWEKTYIKNMDFKKANILTEKTIEHLLKDEFMKKKSVTRHRFLGAATPEGPVDFINNLTSDINKRYFIKGRPGSGKSTLMKKLASNAQSRGIDVEIYHCGFDPDSLDMLIFRELSISIFDSTSPHEYFPDRESDEIIDMYEETINPGTDEKYALQLQDIKKRYKTKIQEGTLLLNNAKKTNDELESIYTGAMNFEYVNKIKDRIISEMY